MRKRRCKVKRSTSFVIVSQKVEQKENESGIVMARDVLTERTKENLKLPQKCVS